jgi:phosphatidate cytidylyltransferase
MAEPTSMTSSPPARSFDWKNLAFRATSAAILIPAVLAAVWYGGGPFLLMIAISVGLMSIEWGKMSAPDAPAEVAVAISVAVLAAVFAAYTGWYRSAWGLMIGGAMIAAVASRGRADRAMDAAYGVIYIAPACIALVWLRDVSREQFAWATAWTPGEGVSWTLVTVAVTWAADIGAYAAGNLFRGPKLWPRISPNKTWSGFIGGLVVSSLAAVAVNGLVSTGLSSGAAALVGFVGGLATMAGDLWESILKRRFGVKDSGDLIPGHGGILDRVDGLMFALIVVGVARLAHIHGWLF